MPGHSVPVPLGDVLGDHHTDPTSFCHLESERGTPSGSPYHLHPGAETAEVNPQELPGDCRAIS